jgi:hypothetical protein
VVSSNHLFVTFWRVARTVQEVLAFLGDTEALPRWWSSVYLQVVEVRDAGPPNGIGET